jgi:hypothetical protein
VSKTWHQEYQALNEFIGNHPEIEISPDRIVTPEISRPDFYSLFDKVRETLVEELYAKVIEESETIVEAYRKALADAIAGRYIEGVLSTDEFNRFIQNPGKTFASPLLSPLFDLLCGKISDAIFESKAGDAVASMAPRLQSSVYQKTIVLSLVNLHKPDEMLECSPGEPDTGRMTMLRKMDFSKSILIPLPRNTRRLSWKIDEMPQLTQPDFIMRSTIKEKNKYIAVRSDFRMPTNPAEKPSKARKWISMEMKSPIAGDVILIYEDDNPLDILLIAETGWICKPDSFIKYRTNSDQGLNQWLESAKASNDKLQPKLGFQLLSRVP